MYLIFAKYLLLFMVVFSIYVPQGFGKKVKSATSRKWGPITVNQDSDALHESESDRSESFDAVETLENKLRAIFSKEKPFTDDDDNEEALKDVLRENDLADFQYLDRADGSSSTRLFERTQRSFLAEEGGRGNGGSNRERLLERPNVSQNNRLGYLNEWVVHLEGGPQLAAKVLADLDYELKGTVTGFADLYRVIRRNHPRLHRRAADDLTLQLNSHHQVVWAEQQESRIREKRNVVGGSSRDGRLPFDEANHVEHQRSKRSIRRSSGPTNSLSASTPWNMKEFLKNNPRWSQVKRSFGSKQLLSDLFNDELVDSQWYLFDTRVLPGLPKLSMGVLETWQMGYTGAGVRVSILDDGLDYTHDDLRDNYDPSISYDFNDDDADPMPRRTLNNVVNAHGTKCAGEVAMAANNGKCGVGVAFGARIGGVRMLDGDVSDRVEAEALSYGRDRSHIFVCAWGPSDDGATVEGPGTLGRMVLEDGVSSGRDGKGTIFVWASGNGGLTDDNCNCDGYASSIYTASITSASQSNKFPWYGERCSSTLASAYSSGAYSDQKIISTDLDNSCTTTFSGTSAAAPLAAGVLALALEANPNLSWRDVHHLIVNSSNHEPLSGNEGWFQNAFGFSVNLRFGHGLIDAERMIKSAAGWTSVGEKVTCEVDPSEGSDGRLRSQHSTTRLFNVIMCGNNSEVGVFLEHVQAVVSLEHSNRGALEIYLTSPRGTVSQLLTVRPKDHSMDGFSDWAFMTVHLWGEDPTGTWNLTFADTSPLGSSGGRVTAAQLRLHAATAVPEYAAHRYRRQFR